jgi:uncharacterized protein (TIGR02569 family)
MGRTWRAGQIVVKPTEQPDETRWRADLLTNLDDSVAFRIARPVRARDGDWIVHGWEAWHVVAGSQDYYRPDDAIATGLEFHRALADLPRPEFLNSRDDAWTTGDRMAWEEIPLNGTSSGLSVLEPLAELRRPVDLPSQVVHGDLLGNVLYEKDKPPAIIDWPVYYRPAVWAAAVIVMDAVCWYDADEGLIERWKHLPDWRQMLIRALIYRVATDDIRAALHGPRRRLPAYQRAARQLGKR